MTRHRLVIACLLALGPSAAQAEEKAAPPSSNAPSPAEKSPLSTTTDPNPAVRPDGGTAMPKPEKSLAPTLPPGATPAASSASPTRQTLIPTPGELNDVDAVTLPAKPAAILSGRAKWDDAVPSLKAAFKRIEDEMTKADVRLTGRPLTVFTKTEDDGFQYDAMIPIEAAPAQVPGSADGVHIGTTPTGKGLRYRHVGSYDQIDGTYETLTAYLDAKDIAVRDQFIEEYVTDLGDAADEKLDVNIYALLK